MPSIAKRHRCYVCGEDMGVFNRLCDRFDTCGQPACDREAREDMAAQREEAHEQLDRDMGWS